MEFIPSIFHPRYHPCNYDQLWSLLPQVTNKPRCGHSFQYCIDVSRKLGQEYFLGDIGHLKQSTLWSKLMYVSMEQQTKSSEGMQCCTPTLWCMQPCCLHWEAFVRWLINEEKDLEYMCVLSNNAQLLLDALSEEDVEKEPLYLLMMCNWPTKKAVVFDGWVWWITYLTGSKHLFGIQGWEVHCTSNMALEKTYNHDAKTKHFTGISQQPAAMEKYLKALPVPDLEEDIFSIFMFSHEWRS